MREPYGSSVKLYLSVNEPELITESIPANTESDDKLAMEDRLRRISSPPPPPSPQKIQGFCSMEELGTV